MNATHPAADLRRAYTLMRRRHGHLGWWPGDTPFEICIGAILTQNTAWTNVDRAIANLKQANVLEPRSLLELSESELAQLIRPAGYFNVKARRLIPFLNVLVREFDSQIEQLLCGSTRTVRHTLLDIHGIGPETADCMLLYAGGHLSFVIDTYTRRIFSRHGWCPPDASYDELKALCESSLSHKPGRQLLDYWQDYHAQLVQVGKDYCRPKNPRCTECPLQCLLPKDASGHPHPSW